MTPLTMEELEKVDKNLDTLNNRGHFPGPIEFRYEQIKELIRLARVGLGQELACAEHIDVEMFEE